MPLHVLRVALVGALLLWGGQVSAETVRVRHALDGDSLLLSDGRQVRLIGINAPELGRDGRPEQPLARAARTLLSSLSEGQSVELHFEQEPRDRYGRLLAHVRLADGRDLGEILVRQGLVWMVAIPPNVAAVARLTAAEDEARAQRRGVWNEPRYRPTPAARLGRDDTGFRFIEGTVRAVRSARHSHFFELAPGVVLTAARADWSRYFDYSPQQLLNRQVVVRGWLTAHERELRMRLQHPAMLTLPDAP